MKRIKTRFLAGSLLCFLCLILLIWTEWPIKSESRNIVFQPGELRILIPSYDESGKNVNGGSSTESLVFPDTRKITLEWTPIIRVGDNSKVTLSFARNNNLLTYNLRKRVEDPTILHSFVNLYDFYTVNSEARIELSGFEVKPVGISGQVLPEDHDNVFSWKIYPDKDGSYEGVAWLYLRLFPILDGNLIEQAVSAQSFDIKVVSILGLNSNYWRVIGVLGIIIGIYYQKERFNGFISSVNRIFINKCRKKLENTSIIE